MNAIQWNQHITKSLSCILNMLWIIYLSLILFSTSWKIYSDLKKSKYTAAFLSVNNENQLVPLPFYLCQSWPVWPFRTNKNGKQALKQLLSFAELVSFVKWWHCSAQSDLSSANRMACDSKSPPKAFLLLFTVHLLGAWRVVRLRFVTKLSQGHLLSSNWSLAIKITRPASSPTIKKSTWNHNTGSNRGSWTN